VARSLVVKSFAELAGVLTLDDWPQSQVDGAVDLPDATPAPAVCTSDLTDLLSELDAASLTLATVIRQDQEARTLALRELEQYDTLVARRQEAERVVNQARKIRREAEGLLDGAFAEEARTQAQRIVDTAARAEQTASGLLCAHQQDVERLAVQLDLERLLAERNRQEEAEKARAAAALQAERLSGALARALTALEAGRFAEARELLGPVTSENPDNPEITSLLEIIAQRERAVKVAAAEEALWRARRAVRRDPAGVVALLSTFDVDGLPTPLARQLFGEWARACSRLCRDLGITAPLRYAPDPGRGAVLAREGDGERYVVVSTLGMGPNWSVGNVVGEAVVRRTRPLR
jgi:hypothetical protein